MLSNKTKFGVLIVGLVTLGSGCKDKPTVYRFSPEAPGANCQYGGLLVQAGKDDNRNGTLDDGEVDLAQSTYACGVLAEGKTAQVIVNPIAAGSTCANGGFEIKAGLDQDDDGTLDANEVESTAVVCNGIHGTDGTDGEDGHDSLVRLQALPTGSACAYGGTKVDSGIDLNDDGILQNSEVKSSNNICSVQVIQNVIVESSVINPGQGSCVNGGVRLTAGVDMNGDQVLQPAEISGSSDMCNQIQVVAGKTSLISTSVATAAQCQFGGYVMQTGLDNDYDTILDAIEVTATRVICNGANGYNSVVKLTADTSVNGCGARGGYKVESGLDTNRSNVLDASEVTNTSYVCNGYTGAEGTPSLIRQSADNSICGASGGVRIETGADTDRNGSLGAGEVDYTSYVCNGLDALVRPVAVGPGINCANGGVRYESGTDSDADGILDSFEITGTAYVCNGDASLIDIQNVSAGGICDFGGVVIYTGIDYDGSGFLESDERDDTTYLCSP